MPAIGCSGCSPRTRPRSLRAETLGARWHVRAHRTGAGRLGQQHRPGDAFQRCVRLRHRTVPSRGIEPLVAVAEGTGEEPQPGGFKWGLAFDVLQQQPAEPVPGQVGSDHQPPDLPVGAVLDAPGRPDQPPVPAQHPGVPLGDGCADILKGFVQGRNRQGVVVDRLLDPATALQHQQVRRRPPRWPGAACR